MYLRPTYEDSDLPSNRQGESLTDLLQPLGLVCWRGSSGRDYCHTIYSLMGCPAPQHASYLLVRSDDDGSPRILAVGRTESEFASLNLAAIRQMGAILGANEVHLHETTSIEDVPAVAEFDLADAHGLMDFQRVHAA